MIKCGIFSSVGMLHTYIQAAIEANTPAIPSTKPKSRRKRNKARSKCSLPSDPPAPVPLQRSKTRKSTLKPFVCQTPKWTLRLEGLVTAKDLEDEDEADEIETELYHEFAPFQHLQRVEVIRKPETHWNRKIGDVLVTFQDRETALFVFESYHQKAFGGKIVTCMWETPKEDHEKEVHYCVQLVGMLLSEEIQTTDQIVAVQDELRQLFMPYGNLKTLDIGPTSGIVAVTFTKQQVAEKVVDAMNGARYRGRLIRATQETRDIDDGGNQSLTVERKHLATPLVQPTESLEVQRLVGAFFKRLVALQARAHVQNPRHDQQSRRVVVGMHQVRRGLKCNKILLLVVATDVEAGGTVEEKFTELVAMAMERNVPILAPFTRRKLGKVLETSVRVSCVGVYSIDGANDLFQQILHHISR